MVLGIMLAGAWGAGLPVARMVAVTTWELVVEHGRAWQRQDTGLLAITTAGLVLIAPAAALVAAAYWPAGIGWVGTMIIDRIMNPRANPETEEHTP